MRSQAIAIVLIILVGCLERPVPETLKNFSGTEVSNGRLKVRIGCGQFAVIPTRTAGPDVTRAELDNIDKLLRDMIGQLRTLDTSRAFAATLAEEQDLWFVERSRYCGRQCDEADPERASTCYLQCLKWASTCRLEEVLARYDSLVSAKDQVHP